jgi:hypothetical protein
VALPVRAAEAAVPHHIPAAAEAVAQEAQEDTAEAEAAIVQAHHLQAAHPHPLRHTAAAAEADGNFNK